MWYKNTWLRKDVHQSILSYSAWNLLGRSNAICFSSYNDLYGLLQVKLKTSDTIILNFICLSHKQEKIVIARKLKKAAIAAEKEKTKKEIEVQLKKLKEDQETLARKKDVAEQLYEEKVSETRKINLTERQNLYTVRGGLFCNSETRNYTK